MIQSNFLEIKWLILILYKYGQHARMHVRLNLHLEVEKRPDILDPLHYKDMYIGSISSAYWESATHYFLKYFIHFNHALQIHIIIKYYNIYKKY